MWRFKMSSKKYIAVMFYWLKFSIFIQPLKNMKSNKCNSPGDRLVSLWASIVFTLFLPHISSLAEDGSQQELKRYLWPEWTLNKAFILQCSVIIYWAMSGWIQPQGYSHPSRYICKPFIWERWLFFHSQIDNCY